jgi:hypothetical protein
MTTEILRDLIRSLAWKPWSSHHSQECIRLLHQLCPGVSFTDELQHFETVITSPPGEGSPK